MSYIFSMARHSFRFDGGDNLTTLGAAWFVSYMWYKKMDKAHLNWKNVSTSNNRTSLYDRTQSQHVYWLKQIINMDESKLDTNKIGLKGYEVIDMAHRLLLLSN